MPPKSQRKVARSPPSAPSSRGQHVGPLPRPDWPSLSPLIPTSALAITTLLPDQILVIPHLFTSTLCKTYTAFLSALPLSTTSGKPKRGDAVRVNDRYQIHDPDFARTLWMQTGLRELVTNWEDPAAWGGEVLGLNPNIRVYRYRPGQFFDQHYDESNKLMYGAEPMPAKTTWTLLLYLSRCEGGETVFYPEGPRNGPAPDPVAVEVEAGLAVLHRHGDECLLHEGREVKAGEKWVLRSDVVVRR